MRFEIAVGREIRMTDELTPADLVADIEEHGLNVSDWD